ncbi:MAG: ABC transporter permease [Bacteroides sp.]|nr:ABC transporter permease [Bacteroides sp.]
MAFELFIARRMYRNQKGGKQVSRPAVFIAMVGIAIGLAVMIVSVALVIGFKKEVRGKVIGFGSHIQVTNFDGVRSYETHPIAVTDSMIQALSAYPNIRHVQRYSTKPGIIKTEDAFQGMVLKGVDQDFDDHFFCDHLLEGEMPVFSDTASYTQVLLSRSIADNLKIGVGDRIYTYFIQDQIRARRLTVTGIYQTNFAEYDNLFLLTHIHTVNRLNNWAADQVSGVELLVEDYKDLEETAYRIARNTDNQRDAYGGIYFVGNIEQLNPQIFGWLELLDLNVWVILILMTGVAGFTMISGLLIIILERTHMISILKSLGANNLSIRKVFLWFSVFLIGRGMFWGNLIGVAFCLIQSHWGLFKLDPESYYVDTVPIAFNLLIWLLLNIGTLLVSVLMLLGPSYLITRIEPANSMRYE